MKKPPLKFDGCTDYVTEEEVKVLRKTLPTIRELVVSVRVFNRTLTDEEIILLRYGILKPLRCHKCNIYFVNRRELMKHIWSAHRVKR